MSIEIDFNHILPLTSLPPTQDSIDEISLRKVEKHINLDKLYRKLTNQLLEMYPNYTKDDLFEFEILGIDFYLGAIACEYDSDNYALSDRIFELNNQLEDVSTMELTSDDLKDIYDALNEVYFDITGLKFSPVSEDADINQIVLDLSDITEEIIAETTEDGLITALRKLYAIIDFCLFEDDEHSAARESRLTYLNAQHEYYSFIHECDSRIEEIKHQMQKTKSQTITPQTPPRPIVPPTPQKASIWQSAILSIFSAAIFYLVYFIVFLLMGFVLLALTYVPIIKVIIGFLGFLLEQWDSSLDVLLIAASFYSASLVVLTFIAKCARNGKTASLSLQIMAIILIVLNVLFLIVNLATSQTIYINVCMIVTALVLYFLGKNERF